MATLATRTCCPGCRSAAEPSVLYSKPFAEDPVRSYLERFYAEQEGHPNLALLAGERFVVDRCADCGLVYQRNVPSDTFVKVLYDEWIDPDWARRNNQQQALRRRTQFATEIERYVTLTGRPPNELNVLDFGSGWGDWAKIAQAFGCNVWGAEVADSRIDGAEQAGIGILPLDAIPAGKFDLINANQVFEHLVHPADTAVMLRQALAPGGLLRIAVPNGYNIARRLRAERWAAPKGSRWSLNPIHPLEHINCFDHRALLVMAGEAGLVEARVPVGLQYRFVAELLPVRAGVRNLVRPLVYSLPLGTDTLFRSA